MTKSPHMLIRALPLAAIIALAATAGAQAAVPIFHCDKASLADREEEIATIRGYLPQLQDPENDIDAREEQIADYSRRLKELELGVSSCKELRKVEKDKRDDPYDHRHLLDRSKPGKAPAPLPYQSPLETDDLIAPADDLLAPTPKPAKPAPSKPKPPMQPFPAPVGDPMFGGN